MPVHCLTDRPPLVGLPKRAFLRALAVEGARATIADCHRLVAQLHTAFPELRAAVRTGSARHVSIAQAILADLNTRTPTRPRKPKSLPPRHL